MDRQGGGAGQCRAGERDEEVVGLRAVGDRPLGREVVVDGFGCYDELPGLQSSRTCESDVENRRDVVECERPSRRGGGLDRPDAADETVVPAELALRRRDEEDHAF